MKKLIVISIPFLLIVMATMNIGAASSETSVPSSIGSFMPPVSTESPEITSNAASGPVSGSTPGSIPSSAINTAWGPSTSSVSYISDRSGPVVSRQTQEERAAEHTLEMIGYSDIFYNEAAYTNEQKTEADTALAHIYSSLYLNEKSESRTISEIKRLTADFLVKRISGLSYMDGSVMLYNYVSINNIKETGEISVNPLLTGSGDRVYSVLAKDQNGRITAAIEITPAFDAFITQYTAVGESYDLKSHAVKAYQLLKMTDLDLSKTTAVYLRLNDFLPMYYLTDGTSRYFLTFGSTDKSAGEQYVEWSLDSFNNENRMRVIKSEDLIKIIQNIDTTNMFDRAYDWAPAMGGGEDALSAAAASAESATSIDHSGNSAPASNEAEQTDATALFSNPTLILVILGTVGVILVLLIILFVRRKQYR